MTKKEECLKMVSDSGREILGSFKNDCGEEYVIFRSLSPNYLLIAGDETDWEWYEYYFTIHHMCQTFNLDPSEDKQIQKIIKKHKI